VHTEAQPTDGTFPPASNPAERQQLARFHAALFPTRLALARWQYGDHLPHLHAGAPALRAAWYANARRDFQAWLDRGGFSQHEEAVPVLPPSPPNPAFWVPPRDGAPLPVGSRTGSASALGK
jgi:hypothetical protein